MGLGADHIGSEGLQKCVESKMRTSSVEDLARTLGTIPETLKIILDGLTQPPGFDIRQGKNLAIHSHVELLISAKFRHTQLKR